MKLYHYIVTRDYGFAPNPFPPACTLATCKPNIRRTSQVGDWIAGIGSAAKGSLYKNKLIYAMQIQEKITFDEYWADSRFKEKIPTMNGSKRQMYGDNIYHRIPNGAFIQEDSHHSLPNGQVNAENYNRDIPGKFVLISNRFWYFGEDAISLPTNFLRLADVKRSHKVITDNTFISGFAQWLLTLSEQGYIGRPHAFNKNFERYSGK